MVMQIALAAEEHGKIVSAQHNYSAVKSYLPTHDAFHKIAPCVLCTFADAIRMECAEAKIDWKIQPEDVRRRNPHGVRRGKIFVFGGFCYCPGRNPHGVRRGKNWPVPDCLPPAPDAIRMECAEAKKLFHGLGSIVEVFTDLSVWAGIRQVIERVNANAAA